MFQGFQTSSLICLQWYGPYQVGTARPHQSGTARPHNLVRLGRMGLVRVGRTTLVRPVPNYQNRAYKFELMHFLLVPRIKLLRKVQLTIPKVPTPQLSFVGTRSRFWYNSTPSRVSKPQLFICWSRFTQSIDWRSKVTSNLSIRGEFNLSASIRTSLPNEIDLVERRQWSHDLVRVDQTTIGTPYAITETQSNQSKQYTINAIKRVHTRSKSRKAIQIKKIHL